MSISFSPFTIPWAYNSRSKSARATCKWVDWHKPVCLSSHETAPLLLWLTAYQLCFPSCKRDFWQQKEGGGEGEWLCGNPKAMATLGVQPRVLCSVVTVEGTPYSPSPQDTHINMRGSSALAVRCYWPLGLPPVPLLCGCYCEAVHHVMSGSVVRLITQMKFSCETQLQAYRLSSAFTRKHWFFSIQSHGGTHFLLQFQILQVFLVAASQTQIPSLTLRQSFNQAYLGILPNPPLYQGTWAEYCAPCAPG